MIIQPYLSLHDLGRLDLAVNNKELRELCFQSFGSKASDHLDSGKFKELKESQRLSRSKPTATVRNISLIFYGMTWKIYDASSATFSRKQQIEWLFTRGMQINHITISDFDPELSQQLQHFHDLQEFVVQTCGDVGETGIIVREVLPCYSNLVKLHIDLTNATTLNAIKRHCPHIESLGGFASDSKIADIMKAFPNLKEVNYRKLERTRLPTGAQLQIYPSIQRFEYFCRETRVSVAELKSLNLMFPNLASLILGVDSPRDGSAANKQEANIFTNLKELDLTSARGYGMATLLGAIPSLEKLSLHYTLLDRIGKTCVILDNRACTTSLKELKLNGFIRDIETEALYDVATYFPCLETLYLNKLMVPSDAIPKKAKKPDCKSMRSLVFDECLFNGFDRRDWTNDSIWPYLAKHVTSLTFIKCNIDEDMKIKFAELSINEHVKAIHYTRAERPSRK
jgi:hypothetical protein